MALDRLNLIRIVTIIATDLDVSLASLVSSSFFFTRDEAEKLIFKGGENVILSILRMTSRDGVVFNPAEIVAAYRW